MRSLSRRQQCWVELTGLEAPAQSPSITLKTFILFHFNCRFTVQPFLFYICPKWNLCALQTSGSKGTVLYDEPPVITRLKYEKLDKP